MQVPLFKYTPLLSYRPTSHLRSPTYACAFFSLFTYVLGAVPPVLQAQHTVLTGSPGHATGDGALLGLHCHNMKVVWDAEAFVEDSSLASGKDDKHEGSKAALDHKSQFLAP